MDDNLYVFTQLMSALEPGKAVNIKVRGPYGESKWVKISPEKFDQILDLFQDEG